MLKSEHFKNTEIILIWDTKINYETDSNSAMDLLEHQDIQSINHIGIYRKVKSFRAVLEEKSTRGIVIDYYHFDNTDSHEPHDHHMKSFKHGSWDTTDTSKILCQHSITIQYPEIRLIKLLYDLGNTAVRKGMIDYIKDSDYLDYKKMEAAETVWFMSIVLGANNE